MYILGISGGVRQGNQDGAACLIHENRIIAAAEEERFNRVKHAAGYLPKRAVQYCLREANISLERVDLIVFPGETYKDIREILRRFFIAEFGHCPKIELINHHIAHAASCYRTSGLKEASILTFDLSGDGISTTLAFGKGNDIFVLDAYKKPNSLGIFYSIVTQYLGFQRDSDEYKVMGLAAYGDPNQDLSWLLQVENGVYRLNEKAIISIPMGAPNPSKQEPFYSEDFLTHYNSPRLSDAPITKYHKDFAASAQKLLEDSVVQLASKLIHETECPHLCLAGGVALNCSMVGVLSQQNFVHSVYVPPASSDAGLAMGSALEIANRLGFLNSERLETASLGPMYTDREIEEAIRMIGADYQRVDYAPGLVAQDIADGKIVGWFNGRMEYGPRALGNRSILADPRRSEMKDTLNARVKFREEFRPFAPAILYEKAEEYFEDIFESPFMTSAFRVKKEKRHIIPAVTHINNTARIQTVNRNVNPLFYEVIASFEKKTGVPMVINTSFNLAGQPIVENPQQAISTFYGCGMDVLYIGSYKLSKNFHR